MVYSTVSTRGLLEFVDEMRGASRRKIEEERRDRSRCGGLVHGGDVISVQQVFGVYDIVYPSGSGDRFQNVDKIIRGADVLVASIFDERVR